MATERCKTCHFAPCRCEDLRSAAAPGGMRPANWPMESDAMGVHPTQAKEAYEESVRHGVPTEFTKKGNPVFRDPAHRKRYCQALGYYDRNGGYSDPQRK